MHFALTILVLFATSALIFIYTPSDFREKFEYSLYMVILFSSLIYIIHLILPSIRDTRQGKLLELFAFVAAIFSVVADEAKREKPIVDSNFSKLRQQAVWEKDQIREIVDEVYTPACDGWGHRARKLSKAIRSEVPGISVAERDKELMRRFGDLDRSCFLIRGGRHVDREGEFTEVIDGLREAQLIGAIDGLEAAIQELEDFAIDPFPIQKEAMEARDRSKFVTNIATLFTPISEYLLFLALAIGAGRAAYFSTHRK